MQIEDFKIGEEYEIDIEQGYERLCASNLRSFGLSLPNGGISKDLSIERVFVEPVGDDPFLMCHLQDRSRVTVKSSDGYSVVFDAYDEELDRDFSFEWSALVAHALLRSIDNR